MDKNPLAEPLFTLLRENNELNVVLVSLPMVREQNEMSFNIPPNPNYSGIL